jgi:hypothetical protein
MSMDNYKDMEEDMFWMEMQELAHVFSELVIKYGMEDRVISAFVVGLLEEINEEQSNMKTFFHYNMQNENELEVVKDFMTNSYTPPSSDEPDIDDLLDGLGISLN